MKKLIIQIPCFNEEASLPVALAPLPRRVPGFDAVEWLVIDDGSTDRTADTAQRLGVDHIIRHPRNLGLARAFRSGLEKAVSLGADVIVNTDADNQYEAADIPTLTLPILEDRADLVIGARPIEAMKELTSFRRLLHRMGRWLVSAATGFDVPDAPSGFRAMSRKTAIALQVESSYTYTFETIIQAATAGLKVLSVPVRVNQPIRPSRLIRSLPIYLFHAMTSILRARFK